MATATQAEAGGLPETPKPPKPARKSPWVWLALVAVLAIVGGVAYALSPGDVTVARTPDGVVIVSPSETVAPVAIMTTTTVTPQSQGFALAAPDAAIDHSTCSVKPVPASVADSQAIATQLLTMRAAGFTTRNQDCFVHTWSGSTGVDHDMAIAAYTCDTPRGISGFSGSATAYEGTVLNFTYQSCTESAPMEVKLTNVHGEWRLAYVH